MAEKQVSSPPEAQPIPLPPDFPVNWEQPDDARRMWQNLRSHFGGQVKPMDFSLLIDNIFGDKDQDYGLPIKTLYRHVNTYLYISTALADDPQIMETAYNQALEKMAPVFDNPFGPWESDWLPEIKELLTYWEDFDLAGASLPELFQHLEQTRRGLRRAWEIHGLFVMPLLLAVNLYDEMYQELFEDAGAGDSFQLLTGFKTKVVENQRALWNLGQRAISSEPVRQILKNSQPDDALGELEKTREGHDFLQALNSYLEEYGKGCYITTLSRPFWIETPAETLRTLKNFLDNPGPDPLEELKNSEKRREESVAQARQLLKNYPAPVVSRFEKLLRSAQQSQVLLSDHCHWIDDQVIYQVRRVLLRLGQRLAQKEVIDNFEDIFYFYFDELQNLSQRLPDLPDRKSLIGQRKELEEKFKAIAPPPVIGAMPSGPPPAGNALIRTYMKFAGVQIPTADDLAPDKIQGHPGAPGLVAGTARVVRSPEDADRLVPGDILVTEFTLPSWTPLFANISALVTDTGGVLSHSAIVAREYGIPAVVGAMKATAVIQDGQRIEVDGNTGTVSILEA